MNRPTAGIESHDLVSATQRGSLRAAREIVERFQSELLGVGYLFTGDGEAASALAGGALEMAFDEIHRFDPDDDLRAWLLRHIPSAFEAEAELPSPSGSIYPAAGAAATRYQVDNDRSRLRNALALLPERERLQIILSDYAGLGEPDSLAIAMLLPGNAAEPASIPATRDRLRGLASLEAGQSTSSALRQLAVDAPRTALWGEIEQEVEEGFDRRRFRSRLFGFAAAGAVVALIIVAGFFLFYGALRSDESPASGAAGVRPSPSSPVSTATPRPTAIPVEYQPVGDVPDALISQIEIAESNWGLYDPLGNFRLKRLPEGALAGISPNGGALLLVSQERRADGFSLTLIAASSFTGEELWRVDVGPLVDSGPNGIYFDLVVIDDLIYIASHDPGFRTDMLTIVVLNLSDGSLQQQWGLDLDVEFGRAGIVLDLLGTSPPLPPALTVHIRDQEQGWQKIHQIDLRSGSATLDSDLVPGLESPPGIQVLAPDGRGMFVIPPGGLAEEPAVSYLIFDTMTQGEIELPFASSEGAENAIVEYVLSHDGRRLYAIDVYGRQVAIVDLERRQVERVIDLQIGVEQQDLGGMTSPPPVSEQGSASGAALSTDGQHLYALGPAIQWPGDPYPPSSPVWKIDTTNWSIEAEWRLGTELPVHSIFSGGSGEQLYVHRRLQSGTSASVDVQTVIVDAASGDVVSAHDWLNAPVSETIAELYRRHYGRSPSVEGLVPVDSHELSAIPAVDVQVEPRTGPIGATVDINVRLLDPATGNPLTEDPPPELRTPTPSVIAATLQNGDERRTAIFGRSPEGDYRGQFELDLPGAWNLTLSAGDPAADGWSVARPAAVRLTDTVTGPDGLEYGIETSSFPVEPVAGLGIDFRVHFVEAGSDPTASLNVPFIEALPPTLDLTLQNGMTTTLFRSGAAAYSGFVRFPTPGVAFPTVTFTGFDGHPATLVLRVEVEPAQ